MLSMGVVRNDTANVLFVSGLDMCTCRAPVREWVSSVATKLSSAHSATLSTVKPWMRSPGCGVEEGRACVEVERSLARDLRRTRDSIIGKLANTLLL